MGIVAACRSGFGCAVVRAAIGIDRDDRWPGVGGGIAEQVAGGGAVSAVGAFYARCRFRGVEHAKVVRHQAGKLAPIGKGIVADKNLIAKCFTRKVSVAPYVVVIEVLDGIKAI